jgi:hypothetical protein
MAAMFVRHSKVGWRMSALGQKRTLQHVRTMSALPLKADIGRVLWNVRQLLRLYVDLLLNNSRRHEENNANLTIALISKL